MFNEIAMHAKAQASNRVAKANRAGHDPRVRAKVKVKRTKEPGCQSIELRSRRSRRLKFLSDCQWRKKGFLMEELGNFKDTTQMDCLDL